MRFSSLPSPPVDHPRSRGVYQIIAAEISRRLGSSPLARGLPAALAQQVDVGGIIPARAGFTRRARAAGGCRWDHPRSRGVYRARLVSAARRAGSSPLARGLPGVADGGRTVSGIIPARAGFTGIFYTPHSEDWDHPRSRGVYTASRAGAYSGMGSSPLARGLHRNQRRGHEESRIIPARAGFTGAAGGLLVRALGSSPLARGLPLLLPAAGACRGIIPARAGFTDMGRPGQSIVEDHPRSRGVYCRRGPTMGATQGSSPLARGLRPCGAPPGDDRRIIPARAGFTVAAAYRRLLASGSSPLARGLPSLSVFKLDFNGIIPARAGFTDESRPGSPQDADHPRSRGVYRGDVVGCVPPPRIIPARAGFTPRACCSRWRAWDHPRSRGVYPLKAGAPQ